ncbi:glycoside hydrolase family 3 N-terminal domain-containing protein [Bacteroides sp. 224]|uniref:glycoside hydrolase family 3 N-terminal domain-containing protein n=1 Tax=Bacteroides sp. 224 TaxID=2302936 RepID=UPI0013D5C38D|nr:glycoside hydrolase family 3 N-terminal domain-containing protein [Bacteroides sp. 224]NDV64044.1 beta-N-acetylglucosaminidase [Bacteroides sp. 224]
MTKKTIVLTLISILSVHLKAQIEPVLYYKATQDERCRQWVDSIFNEMSLKEKVGQLFIYTIAPQTTSANMTLLRDVVKTYKVGGLLFSGGALENYAKLINESQEMAKTPLMITFDGEWGLGMRIKTIPSYPRNMILGCIQDERLIYEYGQEVARQCKELGVHVNFAPVADININPKNPVINTRSFGEDPVNVTDKVIAYSSGLESEGVLSVSKHFPGHGDTDVDSHHSLPVLSFSRERLDSVELYPFKQVIRAGLGGVMVGHLEVPVLEPTKGLPSSLSRNIVNDLLVEELGFRGLVFTDALAMQGAAALKHLSLQAIKAGHDMVLTPRQLKQEIEAVLQAVDKGELSEEEIDRKCKKILTYKYALGLSKEQKIQLSGLEQRINTPQARDLIRRLNLAAITVLKNKDQVLPLHTDIKEVALLHVGAPADAGVFNETLKKYVSVKPITLRGNMGATERKTMHESLAKHKQIIVCVTEKQLTPYQTFFAEFAPETPVTYVFFTQAKPLQQVANEVSKASTVVLAHSTDKFVQGQVGNMLFGEATADGRLSASIGDAFKTGDGVSISIRTPHHFNPADYGFKTNILNRIDSIALEGITKGAYPGCQIVILKEGKTMYDKCFGTVTGKESTPVTPTHIYDIASLTKTSATLLAIMKLYDKGLFNLSDKASAHLPFLKDTDKEDITIRELLYHESGLPSSIFFYLKAINKDSYEGRLFSAKSDALHTVQIGAQTYAQPKFKFLDGFISSTSTANHTLQVSDNMWLTNTFKDSINIGIADAKLGLKQYRYSCVGFVLLQKIAEKLSGMSLDEFLQKEFYTPMGLQRTGYLPLRKHAKDEIVPASTDPFLRKTTVQGYVHDETAAFQGGISGNAGLFSTAQEIAMLHQMLLNEGELEGKRYLSKETCHLFTTAKAKNSRRGLGFDKPDTKDKRKNPCSDSTPASVFGHTGFTGTAAWVDPTNKLVFVFISNRIYPNVWVNELSKQNIRGRIQETMYEALKK